MSKINISGYDLAYSESGKGQPLVFLHGYPFNRSMWSEQLAAFSSGFRVVAIDLRGHGESVVVPGPATMEAMAQDVAGLLERLEIRQTVICGLSMGGYVALAFCRMFPERVRALVLSDTRSQSDTEEGRANRAAQAKRALNEGMAGIADEMLAKLLAPETVTSRPEVVAHLREMMVKTIPEGAAAALSGMAQRADQTSFLPELIVPTLIIVGRQDQTTPVADSEKMHALISGSRLEIIEAAGHVSNLEQTGQFNRALKNFLETLKA